MHSSIPQLSSLSPPAQKSGVETSGKSFYSSRGGTVNVLTAGSKVKQRELLISLGHGGGAWRGDESWP